MGWLWLVFEGVFVYIFHLLLDFLNYINLGSFSFLALLLGTFIFALFIRLILGHDDIHFGSDEIEDFKSYNDELEVKYHYYDN